MTSPSSSAIAGFQLVEQKKTHDPTIEKWIATRDGVASDLYILPIEMKEHVSGLPTIVGFAAVEILEDEDRIVLAVPGHLVTTASKMLESFGPTYSACFAWHISDLLSVLHQSGQAHNWLHPESIGINHLGELEIRPAFGAFLTSDPDTGASAIATDCWQMGYVFERMGVSDKLDPRLGLLSSGLRQDLARLRLQPATAIRQSLSVVLARNSKWEEDFVNELGNDWALNQRTFREHSIIPHRLETEPKVKIQQSAQSNTSSVDMIDLWGNPFSSTEIGDASSGQALLREAFASKLTSGIGKSSPEEAAGDIDMLAGDMDADESTDSLQIPVQLGVSSTSRTTDTAFEDDFSLSALMGMRSIVEENDMLDLAPVMERTETSTFSQKQPVVNDDEVDTLEALDAPDLERRDIQSSADLTATTLPSEDLSTDVPSEPVEEETINQVSVNTSEVKMSESVPPTIPEEDVSESIPNIQLGLQEPRMFVDPDNIDVPESVEEESTFVPEIRIEPEKAVQLQPMVSNEATLDTMVQESEPIADWDDVTSVYVPEPEPSMVDDSASVIAPYDDADVLMADVNEYGDPPAVLLGGIPLIPIVEEVSEDPEVTGAILDTESPSVERVDNPYNYGDESVDDGFVASLDMQKTLVIAPDALDVEEPLAVVEFPSIEEVRSQDASFSGDIDALFDQSEPVVSPTSQHVGTTPPESGSVEPRWTGSTAFDNLIDSEDALGDEKYSMEQAQLGDVDAVLSESIRDYSEVEQKGSVWGMFLVATIIVVFGVLYLLNPESPESTSSNVGVVESVGMTGDLVEGVVSASMVSIQTNPPQGRVYIDNVEVGVAPVEWEATEGSLFMMCVDWGSNPICRRVPKTDLSGQYTFEQVLTP